MDSNDYDITVSRRVFFMLKFLIFMDSLKTYNQHEFEPLKWSLSLQSIRIKKNSLKPGRPRRKKSGLLGELLRRTLPGQPHLRGRPRLDPAGPVILLSTVGHEPVHEQVAGESLLQAGVHDDVVHPAAAGPRPAAAVSEGGCLRHF